MFPLGSVLFPHMPLALRLFEQRYLVMLGRLLEHDSPEFGVVLIERGQEVGGGEHRFPVGTMAQILQVQAREDHVAVVARGGGRFRVMDWLPDDPYPQADLVALPEVEWDEALTDLRGEAEAEVRRALAVLSEFGTSWPSDIQLSDDPVAACWQLAAVTPVGDLDRLRLLQVESIEELLSLTMVLAKDAAETASLAWGDLPPPGATE